MLNIKSKIDKSVPVVIEKVGHVINPFLLNFKNEKNKLLIFYFHGLYESETQKKLNHVDPQNNMTVEQFTRFVEYFLHHNYQFIKAEDLLTEVKSNKPYAMITFDDGYFNNALAVDVLNEYKIPATFFITSKNVLENKSFWWDIIYKGRIKEGVDLATIHKEQSYLKSYKYTYIEKYITEHFGSTATQPISDIDRPFSKKELEVFSKNPFVSIGNHSHNHAILGNYSLEEINEEFTVSNKILAELSGTTPISVAFPDGNFNKLILDVAKKAGFRFAFTTQGHPNVLPVNPNKLICLNRFMAKTSDIKNYGSFIRLGYNSNHLYNDLKRRAMFHKKSDTTSNRISYPKITFGIIVLNGEPFTRYCLRSLYPFAHEIIVVEGGHEDAKSVCTPDGHSIDGTLEALYKFKQEEDVEDKLTIVTRDGFWPKKDELGRNRTPQSRAYAERATGDYLWQIDIDEFYKESDMERIIKMLEDNPEISAVTFPTHTFWGDIKYTADSWALRRGQKYYHRLFKWAPEYKYLTHEPPTVIDEKQIDLRQKKWITGKKMSRKKIYMYHYSLLFPWQVEQKVKVYNDEDKNYNGIIDWAENNYFKLKNPYRVHNLFRLPSWLTRYKGGHPDQVEFMMKDILNGKSKIKPRSNDDVERLLSSRKYNIAKYFLKIIEPLDGFWRKLVFNIGRIKNVPGKIKKIKAQL